MRPLLDMDVIQIEVTNACVNQCSNCTRLVGHSEPFFMEFDCFCRAVDSLVDYPKMVGVMGGEPLLHPRFEEIARHLHTRIPRERCGLWSCLPRGKEHYAPLIAEVFGNILLNDHSHGDIFHCPVLVSPRDLGMDEFTLWYHVHHCWIQNSWSASITPKGAFFCEVAGSLDLLFNGPGGWPVAPGWWKKTPKDFVDQMERYCVNCGVPYPFRARKDSEGVDDVSYGVWQKLVGLNSPKVRNRRFSLYSEGFVSEDYHLNAFRRDTAYFSRIAARYGLGLRQNAINYLEPYLLPAADEEKP